MATPREVSMVLFLNGPVQNGDFTFHDAPGKAVGIRLASALNEIQGHTAAPHLWNTVTLSGDIRHRSQRRVSSPLSRVAFEHTRLMGKYGAVPPPSSVITDADPEVGTLALTMIEEQLTDGTLRIGDATLQECSACGHTVGLGAKRCTSCASGRLRTRTSRNLIKENVPEGSLLPPELLHMSNRRRPRHLEAICRDVPRRLLLSRPRTHGIRLDDIGLRGLVLDPRVGIHVTVLFAARREGSETALMTVTPNALAHIAAYGESFTARRGLRLRYVLHGRVPYDALPGLRRTYEFHRANDQDRRSFENRFLPLLSWHGKSRIHAGQLPALLKYFLKVTRADRHERDDELLGHVRDAIACGDSQWVMDKRLLAAALRGGPSQRGERPVVPHV